MQEGELWMRDDFGRRPDSHQPAGECPCAGGLQGAHKNMAFKKLLQDRHNTTTVMIPSGLTPVIQPCDRTITKEFKRRLKALYTTWALDQTRDDANGKMSPRRGQVATWAKEAWGPSSPEVIRQCFKVCGLTLNLDGSKDHAWCLHTLGRNYRELLADQRQVWENAHGLELPPLQLLDLPAAADATNVVSALLGRCHGGGQPHGGTGGCSRGARVHRD